MVIGLRNSTEILPCQGRIRLRFSPVRRWWLVEGIWLRFSPVRKLWLMEGIRLRFSPWGSSDWWKEFDWDSSLWGMLHWIGWKDFDWDSLTWCNLIVYYTSQQWISTDVPQMRGSPGGLPLQSSLQSICGSNDTLQEVQYILFFRGILQWWSIRLYRERERSSN